MKIVCIVDDPAVFEGVPGLREHHAQQELSGNQWFAVVEGNGATLDHLEKAGAEILDERDDAAAIPVARLGRLRTARIAGERVRDLIKRATGGFDVRKFG